MLHPHKRPHRIHHHGAIIFEKFFFLMMLWGGVFVISCLLIKFFIVDGGVVSGESMYPTHTNGDFFIVDKTAFLRGDPKRYDVVQVIDGEKMLIKRIIGLPEETITIENGSVWIGTGEEKIKLDEPYLPSDTQTTAPLQKGPRIFKPKADEYIILGDNRMHSTDSRSYGAVHRSNIIGRVIYSSPK